MTTRIDMEKAGRKLPNPIFENVVYQQSFKGSFKHGHGSTCRQLLTMMLMLPPIAVSHDKVEYGYCEIRGVEDHDLNIKKTAEFLLQQKWVSVSDGICWRQYSCCLEYNPSACTHFTSKSKANYSIQ